MLRSAGRLVQFPVISSSFDHGGYNQSEILFGEVNGLSQSRRLVVCERGVEFKQKSVLRLVSFLFGKVSLGFVDKQGHRVIFNSPLCNLIVT